MQQRTNRKFGKPSQVLPLAVAVLAASFAPVVQSNANPLPKDVLLTPGNVTRILQQAVAEAQDRNSPASIAVTDRVGNVLAVYVMDGAPNDITIDPGRNVRQPSGLAELTLPPDLGLGADAPVAAVAAIAKAITGAYLSSNGNAFSTRTASQIVQENFNPGSKGLEGGPLFGVQFSQLPCSDLSVRFASNNGGTIDDRIGPKRSPLGFSADPGGLPLYKRGVLVGGVGVMADRTYGLDRNIKDSKRTPDEIIAAAATQGFSAKSDLRAERIQVDGRSLRFSESAPKVSGDAPDPDTIDLASAGSFVAIRGYFTAGEPLRGTAFGFSPSGILPDPDGIFRNDQAYVLADQAGNNRFPPRAGTALSAREVRVILRNALQVALDARAQIRRPLGSHVEVTISVVDTNGAILGIVRTPDAPIFGTDVSLQKARTAMFFSNPAAPSDLNSLPANAQGVQPGMYVDQLRDFAGRDSLGGDVAFSSRSVGNLSRPFFADGQNGRPNGPLSVPFEQWSPFYTGLQLDLVLNNIAQHVAFIVNGSADTPPRCGGLERLANGEQIFSGGVPIYRNGTLVGGVGVSGDGIDQDDMVAFLGLHRAGRALDTGIGNAPTNMRSDELSPKGINLRYVQCPFNPFLDRNDARVCDGI